MQAWSGLSWCVNKTEWSSSCVERGHAGNSLQQLEHAQTTPLLELYQAPRKPDRAPRGVWFGRVQTPKPWTWVFEPKSMLCLSPSSCQPVPGRWLVKQAGALAQTVAAGT